MKNLLMLVSGLALLGTLVPPVLYLLGSIELQPMKLWMVVATVVWFAATPFWLDR